MIDRSEISTLGEMGQHVSFNQIGGIGKAYELFGDQLSAILDELNMRLAA